MAEIRLDKVSKRFPDGTDAVRDASLAIRDGEFFILVGPSGCGKSTLLQLIVGLEEVSSGELRVDGRLVNDVDPRDRNMAMVFQNYALYPHLSVRENIAFPLRMKKLPAAEIERRVADTAAILELGELLARKPGSLSGGQRQRVAMGRAIVREPVAFLLDEPLSNLDARLRTQMRSEIARLQQRLGTTTIYVTHDQTEAMTLGDRVAVMREGVIQQTGTPRELYEQPRNLFVAGFLGSPAMNTLPAEFRDGRIRLPLPGVSRMPPAGARLPSGFGHLIAGIRPEHFQLAGSGVDAEGEPDGFEVNVEMAEWLGADLLVHFRIEAGEVPDLPALAADGGTGRRGNTVYDLIARLDGDCHARAGETLRLALKPNVLALFDAVSGESLTAARA
jgi:multiple sugar transport system ATP-binding protein